MDPVEVIAEFSEQGVVRPLSIKRGSQHHQVDRVSKQWEDEFGKHFIIYLPVEKVMELVFTPATCSWNLKQVGSTGKYG